MGIKLEESRGAWPETPRSLKLSSGGLGREPNPPNLGTGQLKPLCTQIDSWELESSSERLDLRIELLPYLVKMGYPIESEVADRLECFELVGQRRQHLSITEGS